VKPAFVPGLTDDGVPASVKGKSWHDIADNADPAVARYHALIDRWFMNQLARLLTELKSTPDVGGGSLFDSTIVLHANPMRDGATHDSQNLPWLVAAGRGAGGFRTGQHLDAAQRPLTGVLAAVSEAMGAGNHGFGAALSGLRA
jgi:hypothetical protein